LIKSIYFCLPVDSTHNGVFNGKRYFHCPRGHGAMVKYSDVKQCTVLEKRPPLTGNYMFPSFKEIQQQRRKRREQ
jgi:dynactin complex subunit